jgi:hypothetical protein
MMELIPIDYENDTLRAVFEKVEKNFAIIDGRPVSISVEPTPPSEPTEGKIWIDTE